MVGCKSNPIKKMAVLLLVCITVLVGASAASADPVKIKYWYPWTGPAGELMQTFVREFNESHPNIQVEATSVSMENYLDKMLTSIAGGTAPDVSFLWSNEVPGWAWQNALTPLDDYIKLSDMNRFLPAVRQLVTFDNHVWAMPISVNAYGLFYNKKAFKQAGLDPNSPPETISDLDKYAAKLTRKDSMGEITAMGFLPWFPVNWVDTWAHVFGGVLIDHKKNKVTLNDPRIVAAEEWKASYTKKLGGAGKLMKWSGSVGNTAWDSAGSMLYSEKLGMFYCGQFFLGPMSVAKPDWDFGVAPLPKAPTGEPMTSRTEADAFIVPKGAKNPQAAVDFILYLSSPKVLNRWMKVNVVIPPTKEAASNPDLFKKGTPIRAFVDIWTEGNPVPLVTPLHTRIWQEYSAVEDAISMLKVDPKQALDELTEKLQKELDALLRKHNK